MLYMVIERFGNEAAQIYQRFREHGRMLPDGLKYVNSWVKQDHTGCYQLMECDDVRLLEQWTSRWNDLVEFEIFAVETSQHAVATYASRPDVE